MSASARDLWRVVEPFHQLAYRSPAATDAYVALGLTRPDQRYFANRLAAAGPVGRHTAVALLFGFAPDYVARAIPEIWEITTPAEVSAARAHGARVTLDAVIGDEIDSDAMSQAAATARRLVEATDLAGRPLAGAHRDLGWPPAEEAGGAAMNLWHACTVLREHRGDAHWAMTAAAGLDAVTCHVLHAADGAMPAELLQQVSGWDDEAWAAGVERLVARGLVAIGDHGPEATTAGRQVKWDVEAATDREAARALDVVSPDEVRTLIDIMRPWVRGIIDAEVVGAWKLREQLWRDLGDRPS